MKEQLIGRKLNNKGGFATLELLIAFTILILCMGGVIMVSGFNEYHSGVGDVSFENQSITIDSQTNNEAISKAQALLEKARADSRLDFGSVVTTPIANDDIYKIYKTQIIIDPASVTQCGKDVQSSVSWTAGSRPLNVNFSTHLGDIANAIALGGDCIIDPPESDWTNPQQCVVDTLNPGKSTAIDVLNRIAYLGQDKSPFLSIADTRSVTPAICNPAHPSLSLFIPIPFLNGFDAGETINDIDVAGWRDPITGITSTYAYVAMKISTQSIAAIDSSGNVGQYTSLAIGSDGFARISYYDATNRTLKFAQCTNVNCSTNILTTIDATSNNVGLYTSLALGSDGFARISYYDAFNNDLKFARCTDDNCSSPILTAIDTVGDVGQYTSLALGSDGFARISYYDVTGKDLKFVHCTNNDCTTKNISIIESSGTVGQYTSLALGPDGFARISYYRVTSNELKFTRCTDDNCSSPIIAIVDTAGDVGQYSSMALGSDGFARISYYDNTANDLKFTHCTNADCTSKNSTAIDVTGNIGLHTSTVLGSDGFSRISYYDATNNALKILQCTNDDCTTKNVATVDSTGNVGQYSALTLGLDGFARISYYDTTNTDLKFVQCGGGCTDAPTQFAVIDVSDINNPVTVATRALSGVDPTGSQPDGYRIYYYDKRVYILTHDTAGPEFHIFDVSIPISPIEIGKKELTTTVNDLVVRNDIAYLAAESDARGELLIYDVSNPVLTDPNSIFEIVNASRNLSGNENGASVYFLGDKLYLGRESVGAGPELYIFDASSPRTVVGGLPILGNPAEIGTDVLGIRVTGKFAFLATSKTNEEFQIWNISRPDSITLIKKYNFGNIVSGGIDYEPDFIYSTGNATPNFQILYSP